MPARKLTLYDCYTRDLYKHPLPSQPHWMKDRKTLCYIHTAPGHDCTTLWRLDTDTGEIEPLIDVQKVRIRPRRALGIDNFLWSPDERLLLLCSHGPARISVPGHYYLYEPSSGALRRLSIGRSKQRNAKFSPDSKSVGFVRGDDLWLVDIATGAETRLTELAGPGLYVGRYGWVYEEELGQVDGWSFSPDGRWIAFVLVDERRVPEVSFIDYGPKHPKQVRMRYPKAGDPNPVVRLGVIPASGGLVTWMDTGHEEYGYLLHPQWTGEGRLQWLPGEGRRGTSPHHSLPPSSALQGEGGLGGSMLHAPAKVEGLESAKAATGHDPEAEPAIGPRKALDASLLIVQRLNRLQNRLDVLCCDPVTGKCRAVITETDQRWVESPGKLHLTSDDRFVWLSEKSGWRQLQIFELRSGRGQMLTNEQFDISSVAGLDETTGFVYFLANSPEPWQMNLFRVPLPLKSDPALDPHPDPPPSAVLKGEGELGGSEMPHASIRAEQEEGPNYVHHPSLGKGEGEKQGLGETEPSAGDKKKENDSGLGHSSEAWASVERVTRDDGWHSVCICSHGYRMLVTHSTANTPHSVTVRDMTDHTLYTIVKPEIEALRRASLPRWEFVRFRTSDGVSLNARMLVPSRFRTGRKYPAVIATYGGPRSQVVTDAWGSEWLAYYLTQQGFVYFMCDGRGSGGRGSEFAKCTYMNLGHWEAHDQIEAARFLASLDFVDAERIAIWGWSYGGYLSALATLLGGDVFAACMCVAPVTHWELYDSIYTERYMRTPQDNPEGYARSAAITHADKLRCRMLVVHGMADDNVHFQHAVRLVQAFQRHGKQFEVMFYPGKKHGIEGMREHIFTMFESFLRRSLVPTTPIDYSRKKKKQ